MLSIALLRSYESVFCCCGRQEEPSILISRLLLRTHRMYVCSQLSFGLPLRMNGMHRTQFNHVRLDLLSLVSLSLVFWPSVKWNVRKAQRWSKSVLVFDRCRPHSVQTKCRQSWNPINKMQPWVKLLKMTRRQRGKIITDSTGLKTV